jgi:hypothetical protein
MPDHRHVRRTIVDRRGAVVSHGCSVISLRGRHDCTNFCLHEWVSFTSFSRVRECLSLRRTNEAERDLSGLRDWLSRATGDVKITDSAEKLLLRCLAMTSRAMRSRHADATPVGLLPAYKSKTPRIRKCSRPHPSNGVQCENATTIDASGRHHAMPSSWTWSVGASSGITRRPSRGHPKLRNKSKCPFSDRIRRGSFRSARRSAILGSPLRGGDMVARCVEGAAPTALSYRWR